MNDQHPWGWRAPSLATDSETSPHPSNPSSLLARVIAEHRDGYRLATATGERRGTLTGKLRHAAETGSLVPAVGDWVRLVAADGCGPVRIAGVLPRRSTLQRADPDQTGPQVLAANVDRAFVVTSANGDFNLRRLERFLTAIYDGGVTPGVIVSKADLVDDAQVLVDTILALGLGIQVFATSSFDPHSLTALADTLQRGETLTLLGTSGVGKSTLVNGLLGEAVQRVLPIRDDLYRGRHTTTHRQLFQLPCGALLIDTPGIRQIQVWDGASLETTFQDVETLSNACRFRDCGHNGEPGCAVEKAIQEGEFAPTRLEAYRKLSRERAYVERRRDSRARHEQRQRAKRFTRAVRNATRNKPEGW